jgi:hypothetical protein
MQNINEQRRKIEGNLANQELHCYRKLGYSRRRETVPLSCAVLKERSNREENEEHRTRRSKKKDHNLQEERCETEK